MMNYVSINGTSGPVLQNSLASLSTSVAHILHTLCNYKQQVWASTPHLNNIALQTSISLAHVSTSCVVTKSERDPASHSLLHPYIL